MTKNHRWYLYIIFSRSMCYTKRRMDTTTGAHVSFGMTITKDLRDPLASHGKIIILYRRLWITDDQCGLIPIQFAFFDPNDDQWTSNPINNIPMLPINILTCKHPASPSGPIHKDQSICISNARLVQKLDFHENFLILHNPPAPCLVVQKSDNADQ